MGLKCRLLGHAYGEPEVERNREEQGDEVVVTIREVQTCERCGAEQVVSQNKEVTSIRSPDEVGLDEGAADEGGATPTPEAGAQDAAEGGTAPEREGDGPSGRGDAASPASTPEEWEQAEPKASGDRPGGRAERAGTGDGAASDGDGDGAMAQIDEAEPDAGGDGWETGSDDWDDVDGDGDGDDAVILDTDETERDETQWPEETDADPTRAAAESGAAENAAPATSEASPAETGDDERVTNDAEIIDADHGETDAHGGSSADAHDDASGDRDRGDWPEREGHESSASEWPEHDREDEGFAAQADAATEMEFGGNGLTPEVNGQPDPETNGEAPATAGGERSQSLDGVAPAESRRTQRRADSTGDGFARAGESTTLEADVPDDRVEFYCPNCGYARVAGESSMRAGDICPECKQGYIAERER
ncbi:MAG: hypothetical protein ABEK02_01485 [Haloquadratum sp.]